MTGPWWWYVLIGGMIGASLYALAGYWLEEYRKASAKVTLVRQLPRLSDGFEARCLECGRVFRHADPWEASSWAYEHQHADHGRL